MRGFARLRLGVPLGVLAVLAGSLLLGAVGCAAQSGFGLTAEDNNPAAIAGAIQGARAPKADTPLNATGRAMAFAVTAGATHEIIAWDLAESRAVWRVPADVTSRIAVAGPLVAHLAGKSTIVARDVADGHQLWTHELDADSTFLGLATDGERVYYSEQGTGGPSGKTWSLVAVQGGKVLWRQAAPGSLGAPAARGSLVFMPFMAQWLSILDGPTGKPLARVRQEDEAINFVRTTSDGVFYGSKGVFALNDRSFKGTKTGASYGVAKLPDFVRTFYHFDAFNPQQSAYTAYDRNRILWRGLDEDGKLAFRDDRAIVFTWRFFFGFDAASGELRWAYNHPGGDVVAAEHVGAAVLFVSQAGELSWLDPKTGRNLPLAKLGASIQGVTFDADGFTPPPEALGGQPGATYEALGSIIFEKDTRYQQQKLFAVAALAPLPYTAATEMLLRVVLAEGMNATLAEKASEALVARKDVQALDALIAAVVTPDYLTGRQPRALEVVANALGGLGRGEATPALVAALEHPETPQRALGPIARALATSKDPNALGPLRTLLLLHRADPTFAEDSVPLTSTIDALLALGGGAERELVAFVAEDPRTVASIAEYARRALVQTGPRQQGAAK